MIHWKTKVVGIAVLAASLAALSGSLFGGLLRAFGCAW